MLLTPGFLTVLAFAVLFLKMKRDTLRKLLGFDLYVDILVGIVLMYIFAGTYSGMMVAMVAGLGFSGFLWLLKKCIGYKRLVFVNTPNHLLPTLRWFDVHGWFHQNRMEARKCQP